VVSVAGPWRTTGDWWRDTAWARDEWDVGLEDGALYRVYREHGTNEWFVEGAYD
jgi:protein ImuB